MRDLESLTAGRIAVLCYYKLFFCCPVFVARSDDCYDTTVLYYSLELRVHCIEDASYSTCKLCALVFHYVKSSVVFIQGSPMQEIDTKNSKC